MPFGVVREVGRGMGILDGGGDRRRRGIFGCEFGASLCNQWGLCDALFSNYFEDLLYSFFTKFSAVPRNQPYLARWGQQLLIVLECS